MVVVELVGAGLMLCGSAFVLIASIGLLRFPDVLMRMHATTKAGTLGVGLVCIAAMFFFGEVGAISRSTGVILFILLTAPISAHMISRAAYIADVELWEGTFVDQLREQHRKSGASATEDDA